MKLTDLCVINDRFWRPYKAPSPGIFSGGVYGNLKSLKPGVSKT